MPFVARASTAGLWYGSDPDSGHGQESFMPQNIIVAVDFSNGSKDALRQAVRLARHDKGTVQAVHIIDSRVVEEMSTWLNRPLAEVRQETINSAQEDLKKMAAEVSPDSPIQCVVHVGTPLREMLLEVRSGKAELLMLGRNGASDAGRGPGTFAMACARKAECSVMLIAAGHTGPFRKVMVGVDFSDTCRRAVSAAAELAGRDRSTLRVVHTFFGPWTRLHYRAPTPSSPEFQQQYRQSLQRQLEHFIDGLKLPEGDFTLQSSIEGDYSSPAFGLIRLAGEFGADLIVVGTRSRSGLMRLLLGSTAERVLREAECTVLVVKPSGFAYELE
jgi:nucleotide-binding universal stress UspA family protein